MTTTASLKPMRYELLRSPARGHGKGWSKCNPHCAAVVPLLSETENPLEIAVSSTGQSPVARQQA
jgi:hypothetical protein